MNNANAGRLTALSKTQAYHRLGRTPSSKRVLAIWACRERHPPFLKGASVNAGGRMERDGLPSKAGAPVRRQRSGGFLTFNKPRRC